MNAAPALNAAFPLMELPDVPETGIREVFRDTTPFLVVKMRILHYITDDANG